MCRFLGTQAQVEGPPLLLIFASHLRQGLLVFTAVFARPAGLRASGEHSASASHLDIGTLALQTIPRLSMDSGDVKSGSHACAVRALPTESSTQPHCLF